jgi:hypothetical protein
MQQMLDSYRIPVGDFDRVARNTRLTEKSLVIAREILVEGKDMAEVASRYQLTRQRVMAIRDKVFSAYLRNSMFPPDWVRASVCAPQEMLNRFLTEVEQERIKYFSQNG